MVQKIRVLMVDDHRVFTQSLEALISKYEDIDVVATYTDANEALEDLRKMRPDVVIMDLNMPTMNGQEATRRMLEMLPALAIVILTMEQDAANVHRAVKSGVKGYLLKDTEVEDLVKAIRAAHNGEAVIDPRMAARLMSEFQRTWQGEQEEQLGGLKPRDIEILSLLGLGLSNKEIGTRLGFSEKTIKNYLSMIFQKLNFTDRTQAAVYALQNGLVEAKADR